MKFKNIFDVYSRRNEKKLDIFIYSVPETLRNKILLFCKEVFSGQFKENSNIIRFSNGGDYFQDFLDEIHKMLLYRHGKFKLTDKDYGRNETEDTICYLLQCKDQEFLDFVEYIFKVECLFHVCSDENSLVCEINRLFESENVGFELTEIIKEKTIAPSHEYAFLGRGVTVKIIQYPKVICKDSQVIHELVIKPTLQLLADNKYKTAREEYLEALTDYNNSDYGSCLVKCGSALESVLKIICHHKKWKYNQHDTMKSLIKIYITNTNLDPYFEQYFMIISNLRNKLSKAHGSGVQLRNIPKHYAKFALNTTASVILFLIDEANS